MKNLFLCVLLQLFTCLGISGFQSPPVSSPQSQEGSGSILHRASALLDSHEPSDRAWGAYLAGKNNLSDLQPKLEKLLDDVFMENEYVARSILEAEIRLSAVLPEKILLAAFQKYPNETIVLLGKAPDRNAKAILSIFQRQILEDQLWFALGNLLLEIKSPEFPLILMQDIKQSPITVYVRNSRFSLSRGLPGSGFKNIQPKNVPLNYPPIILYEISVEPPNPIVVVFKGPRNFYAVPWIINSGERYISDERRLPYLSDSSLSVEYRIRYQLEYLSSILGLPEAEISFNQIIHLDWKDSRHYKEEMRLQCSRILAINDRLTNRLRDRGLITASQAKNLGNSIALKIYDNREDKTVSLPDLGMNRVVIEKVFPK